MRSIKGFSVSQPKEFKNKLLQWSREYREVAWLDSNNFEQNHGQYEAILAVGAFTAIKTDYHSAFDKLQEYQETTKDWIFGYLSYDLKNDVEQLQSQNFDGLHFPDLYFFQPQKIFLLKGDRLEMHYLNLLDDEMEDDFDQILNTSAEVKKKPEHKKQQKPIQARIPKQEYLKKVRQMLAYIQRGDIYEANFCQEFFAEDRKIEPVEIFQELNAISGPPFATFLRLEEHFLLCASPERYLKKTGSKLLSQPIKGTARRSEDSKEDSKIIETLENDPKERSENVMIVDLVRNDLSRIAKRASVKVEELCRVYSFKQVHQMISTISAELENGLPVVEALRVTFPMGSMTGAPKISAMKIIEELEETKRGLYSGAVGYFTPQGDFDFNVVIRSILYNEENQYVSFSVGGAITAGSDPEKEYEECLLKAKAMRQVLS
ncbi:aminodeoxychorismate synthase component I [Salegentibacter sp. HM20]